MQVKRLIKTNKYHIKSLQDTYSKKPAKELFKSKVQVDKKRKKYKTVINLFQDSPHPDPASCGNQSVEFR